MIWENPLLFQPDSVYYKDMRASHTSAVQFHFDDLLRGVQCAGPTIRCVCSGLCGRCEPQYVADVVAVLEVLGDRLGTRELRWKTTKGPHIIHLGG